MCVYQQGFNEYFRCWSVPTADSLSWEMPEDLSTGFWVGLTAYNFLMMAPLLNFMGIS